MPGLGQKIKDAVTPGHKHRHEELGTTGGAVATHDVHTHERMRVESEGGAAPMASDVGATSGLGAGGGGMPLGGMAGTEPLGGVGLEGREMEGRHHHHGVAGMAERAAEGQKCGEQRFVQVEDRPVVKERVERIVEHHPVEKEYVTETRFVGERQVPSEAGATSLGVTERVIEAAQPGPACPAPGAPIMGPGGEHLGRVGDRGTMDV